MKIRLITLFTVFLLLTSCGVSSQSDLRIMTYNIRNGVGMDMKSDYMRTANTIKKFSPDIVAIQEVDSVTNRSNRRFVLGELSQLTEMYYYYAPAIDYDGGKYGTGLLSKEKPLHTSYMPLPGKEEQRVLLIAEFDKFVLFGVHLSLTAEDQLKSIQIIEQELSKIQKPVIIAGDFNAHPDSDVMKLLKKTFTVLSPPEKTFPADKPIECLDYIALDTRSYEHGVLQDNFVIDESVASDHRPVLVDIILR